MEQQQLQQQQHLAVGFGCLLFLLLLRLVFGLLLLYQLLLLLQHGHDVGHLAGGDVHVLLVNQLYHLRDTTKAAKMC